ncbi:MAG: DUF4399 domain-containing protein [Actinomycetota bacterium]
MPRRTFPLRLVIALLAAVALTAACGGSSSSSAAGYGTADVPTGSVSIIAPLDGAVLSGPVDIEMGTDGFEVEPAGAVRSGAGHLHLMIDIGCVEPGEVIPADGAHLHLGDGSTLTTLDLAPGEYSLCLQAGDGAHTALDLTDSVTFTVTR